MCHSDEMMVFRKERLRFPLDVGAQVVLKVDCESGTHSSNAALAD